MAPDLLNELSSEDRIMQKVLSPRDASILSLIARVAGSETRQRDVFQRNYGQLESEFAQEVAKVLVGDEMGASPQAIQTAKAMKDWVITKIARFSANPRNTKLARASGGLYKSRSRSR